MLFLRVANVDLRQEGQKAVAAAMGWEADIGSDRLPLALWSAVGLLADELVNPPRIVDAEELSVRGGRGRPHSKVSMSAPHRTPEIVGIESDRSCAVTTLRKFEHRKRLDLAKRASTSLLRQGSKLDFVAST